MRIFTLEEIEKYAADGTFNTVEVINHKLALKNVEKQKQKDETLAKIKTSSNAYVRTFAVDFNCECKEESIYQHVHVRAVVDYTMSFGARLSPDECMEIVEMFPEDNLNVASIGYIAQQAAKIIFPDDYPGETAHAPFIWTGPYIIAYYDEAYATQTV